MKRKYCFVEKTLDLKFKKKRKKIKTYIQDEDTNWYLTKEEKKKYTQSIQYAPPVESFI